MITIGIHNIENIIFENKTIRDSLPRHKQYFDSWQLSKSIPFMRALGTRSILQFIDQVTDEDKKIISDILKTEVYFLEIDLTKILSYTGTTENIEFELPLHKNINEIAITRSGDKVGVTLHAGESHE
jgi:signal transduction protein with GAF and PtsI domain